MKKSRQCRRQKPPARLRLHDREPHARNVRAIKAASVAAPAFDPSKRDRPRNAPGMLASTGDRYAVEEVTRSHTADGHGRSAHRS